MPNIEAIQKALRAQALDGWLFYDFHHRDPIATSILGLTGGMGTRRWFYMIPARGSPRKLVHRVEPRALDTLPGEKLLYSQYRELYANLPRVIGRAKRVAMQYSPKNAIPYVSMVDAGTIELVRSAGCSVFSSADLVQEFQATWSEEQYKSHLAAGRVVDRVTQEAFVHAASKVRAGAAFTEYELQQWMVARMAEGGVTSADPPIAAIGANSSDPHYEPTAAKSAELREGELLLLDVWGKLKAPGSVYYDITWVGFLGATVPPKYAKVFAVVQTARDRAVAFVQNAVAKKRPIEGWKVDHVAREVIRIAGYGEYFVHRLGHNIGEEIHGTGANMDGFETRDVRRVLTHTCFSIEPGIYLAEFGIRSEVDVFVDTKEARVTGAAQTEILALLG